MILELISKSSIIIGKSIKQFSIFLCIFSTIFAVYPALATENILIYPDARYVDISDRIQLHKASSKISILIIRPAKGEKKFLNVQSADGTTPKWVSFALTNSSNKPFKRLLVVPHYGGGNDGLLMPILSGTRIVQLYASTGTKPSLQKINGKDVFLLELPADKTVTFLARVGDEVPTLLNLWDADSYQNNLSYLPFYQGLIIGILTLFVVLVSGFFIVKREILFVVAVAIGWGAFLYNLHEFGFLTAVLPENAYLLALIRALSELAITSLPLLLVFAFFNKNYTLNLSKLITLSPIAIAAIGFFIAFLSPSLAASIARINAILVVVAGSAIIFNHWPTHQFSKAKTFIPIWLFFSVWSALQIFMALNADILYLNLLISAVYMMFMLMAFIALLQDFTANLQTENIQPSSPSLVPEAITQSADQNTLQSNIPNIAIAGSGQVLWEWDLLEGVIKCGTELDDLLHYYSGTMSDSVHNWINYIHMRDTKKFENLLTVILEEGNSRIDQDIRLRAASGEYLWFELRAVALTDDEGYLISFVGTLNDVTIRKSSEDRLFQDAVHDGLTGLPNRSLFFDRLSRSLARADNQANPLPALILVDIDRFKAINDSVGIAGGDSLLMMVARRLEKNIKETDTVARLSADQFAIILTEYDDTKFVTDFAEKLRQIIAEPIMLNDREIVITTSVGVVMADNKTEKTEDLLLKAEIALGAAKKMGNDSVILFSNDLQIGTSDRFTRENDLRQAIARNEFEMFYQPIISLETMRPVGFEALIRWQHPTEGEILPSDFIQLAEETGQIHELGEFALTQAAKQLNIWQRTFSRSDPLFVSVNMSSLQLFQPKLVEQVQDVLNRFNVINNTLKLEVTESLVMKNPELARQILTRLKDIGAGLAVDDFGTGYSSLSYLHHFPFDVIKIDRSFISGENFGETRPIILKAIIQLARDLGLKVVAEGVEHDEQAHELIDLGCEWVQGYRFGLPMTAKDSLNFLSANLV